MSEVMSRLEHNETLKAQLSAARQDLDPDEIKLEQLLDTWARWMKSQNTPRQFHIEARSVGQGFTSYGDPDYRDLEVRLARTVNAVINDNRLLTPLQWASLYVRYLGGLWQWSGTMEIYLDIARAQVRAGCIAKGVFH